MMSEEIGVTLTENDVKLLPVGSRLYLLRGTKVIWEKVDASTVRVLGYEEIGKQDPDLMSIGDTRRISIFLPSNRLWKVVYDGKPTFKEIEWV